MNWRFNSTSWIVFAAFLLAITVTATGNVIYVDVDANGLNDGLSWADAYNYLQDALADANYAAKPVEIRAAEGIYTPDSNSADPNGSGDRTATFHLIDDVTVKGGYAGFGEVEPNARDIELYETILSGDLAGNDADVNEFHELLGDPCRAENSYHVVTGSGTDANAVLDGFTVTGGRADIGSDRHGAGMYNEIARPTVVNCTFTRNIAYMRGGGMYNFGSWPNLSNCIFEMNKANYGGGIYNDSGSATVTDCKFTINIASYEGGGMHSYCASLTVTNCKFTGNASNSGGGMYNNGGSRTTLANCVFSNNSAYGGGGIRNRDSQLMLTNCTFNENITFNDYSSGQQCIDGGSAGAIDDFGSKVTFINCAFVANRSGVYGAIVCHNSYLSLSNCTFAGNSADYGNGLVCVSVPPRYYKSELELNNCIFWDGGNEIWSNGGSAIIINYTDMDGGQMAVYDPCEGLVWGVGNMNVAPCFVELGHWEDPCNTPGQDWDDIWINGDYHLKSQAGRWEPNSESWVRDDVTSPCIDAGDWMSPVGLEPFPNGGIINMGVYGGTAEASKSYFGEPVCETIVAGDVNGDCIVNYLDFRLMSLHWLEDNNPSSQPPPPPPPPPPG